LVQNKSHAVMAQRAESKESLDDFPTPPWATRALIEHVIGTKAVERKSCLEPACNRGFMARPLSEYFKIVRSSDVVSYGFGEKSNFLNSEYEASSYDWVITNPPFKLAEAFIEEGLRVAKVGVAVLVRTVFVESVGRYERLFSINPPWRFAQFVERVPMVKGRVDKSASTATGYCWLVWHKEAPQSRPELCWIPPCRKSLEREDDYLIPGAIAEQQKLF
jgi:hypothetical protein